ncbi:MAG: asparagine synthase (glutamine-hydrolyzing) [Bdellovibrionota bacterium]
MCGIAGIIEKGHPTLKLSQELERFAHCIAHRGPNDRGAHVGDGQGFLNVRLSIVDVSSGHQPIYSRNNELGIVYNGEVYNYLELKELLVARGHHFQTSSDTEVVLRLFEEFGTASFEKLNGMFAFCLWDERERVSYLVRDHFGIKPLYVYEDEHRILFASEIKALLAFPDLDLELSPEGAHDYLTFRYMQAPFTMFRRIRRLDAGTFLKISHGHATQFRFYDIEYRDDYPPRPASELAEELRALLEKAVRSQLMGEVPIGVLLSGGLDSSSIAYFVHTLGARLTTYNIGFPEVNEFEFSREVAKRYDLEHVEVTTTAQDLVRDFDSVLSALDEPIADPACFPLFELCKELKRSVTVVLSGEGGDELFAGYPQYKQLAATGSADNSFGRFLEGSYYFSNQLRFLNDQHLPPHHLRNGKYFAENPLVNGMLAYDMKTWMPDNLMMKADKILMAHSLEGRFPFLDRELFEFSARLPQAYKLNANGETKWLLKQMMLPKLPELIITRPKMGFSVPVSALLDSLRERVLDTGNAIARTALSSVLNADQIRRLFERYYSHGEGTALQVWSMFVLCSWFTDAFPAYRKRIDLLKAA